MPHHKLSPQQKLTVQYRVEPGCLGPDGVNLVDGFCRFASEHSKSLHQDFIDWVYIPRHDKSLPELQYKIGKKNLNHGQASRYLSMFDEAISQFEDELHENIAIFIDDYLGH